MADHAQQSKAATEAYRQRMFVGVGESIHEAMRHAFDQANAAGYDAATPIAHRFTPKDTDWHDADWRDADWRDADWRDADWRDADWRDADWRDADWRGAHWHTVILHARKSKT